MESSDPIPASTTPTVHHIAAALLVAQKALKNVEKGSKNEYHGYDYTSADDMIKCAREALHTAGLTFQMQHHDLLPMPEIAAVFADPEVPPFIFVRSHFRLEYASTGEFRLYQFDLPAIPEKGRPLDKAILGCMTTSTSYALRDLLQIPREDPDEVSRRDDTDVRAPRRPQSQTWQQKKAEQAMEPRPPSGPSPSTKAKLWSAIAAWTGINPKDSEKYGAAGRRVYDFMKIDPKTEATEQQLNHALIFVNDKIRGKVDFAAWAGDIDEKAAAEKALADKPTTAPASASLQFGGTPISEEDIPFSPSHHYT